MIPLSLIAFSCSHTQQYSGLEQLILAVDDTVIEIKTVWGHTLHAKTIQVDSDSVRWVARELNSKHSAPLKSINKISLINRKKGAWLGFRNIMYGALCVGGLIILQEEFSIFPDSNSDAMNIDFGIPTIVGYSALMGGFYGLSVGVPVGAFIGFRDVYIITEVPPNNNSRLASP